MSDMEVTFWYDFSRCTWKCFLKSLCPHNWQRHG
jgi:hypothetical protein